MKFKIGTFTPVGTETMLTLRDAADVAFLPKKVVLRVSYNGKVVGYGQSDGTNQISGSNGITAENAALIWVDAGVEKIRSHFKASIQTVGRLRITHEKLTATTGVLIEYGVWGD